MKEIRTRQGVTAEQLASRMREIGVPFDKTVIANLETGRRRYVTLQEVFALAYVLNVAPINLITPTTDELDETYIVLPTAPAVPPVDVRDWVRGIQPMPGQDEQRFYTEVSEVERTLQRQFIAQIIDGKLGLSEEFRVSVARDYAAGRLLPVVSATRGGLMLFSTGDVVDKRQGTDDGER